MEDRMNYLFESPPMKIGTHEWRVVVMPSQYSQGRCTEYQFRRTGDTYWKPQYDWPGYDINDGLYGGMPRSIVRLYERHKAELQAWLKGEPKPQGSVALIPVE
jgi:hypothetical protein